MARKRFFVILDPFLDSFSDVFQARNIGFYGIFVFCRSFTAIFKNAKTIVNTSVFCRPVAKNLANTTVFGRWVKQHCKLRCFWPPDLQKPRYLQWFLPPRAQPCKKWHFCRFFSCSCCCCCCCCCCCYCRTSINHVGAGGPSRSAA